jgi:hypothetical protein
MITAGDIDKLRLEDEDVSEYQAWKCLVLANGFYTAILYFKPDELLRLRKSWFPYPVRYENSIDYRDCRCQVRERIS